MPRETNSHCVDKESRRHVDGACGCQCFSWKGAHCETMAVVFMPGGQQAVYLVVEEQDVTGSQAVHFLQY